MYDILQLNDMLVPELLDIAEQLKIPNAKKLDKQGLVYKILDRQAVVASENKGGNSEDKTKRKRIIKTSTGITTEEAVVEDGREEKKVAKKPIAQPKGRKTCAKKIAKGRKHDDETVDREQEESGRERTEKNQIRVKKEPG